MRLRYAPCELRASLEAFRRRIRPNSDIFALFEEQRAQPEAELLVRAKARRKVAGGGSLLESLRNAPVRARAVVAIDRLTARPKSSKRAARPGRARRSATLVLRACTVEPCLSG